MIHTPSFSNSSRRFSHAKGSLWMMHQPSNAPRHVASAATTEHFLGPSPGLSPCHRYIIIARKTRSLSCPLLSPTQPRLTQLRLFRPAPTTSTRFAKSDRSSQHGLPHYTSKDEACLPLFKTSLRLRVRSHRLSLRRRFRSSLDSEEELQPQAKGHRPPLLPFGRRLETRKEAKVKPRSRLHLLRLW